jgi:hypothetical protein
MNLKSIKLDSISYHDYLEGKEVHCSASAAANKHLAAGEHVLVYRDTVAASTAVSPPKREMQSEYIGIEGTVTRVSGQDIESDEIVIQKLGGDEPV